VDFPCGVIYKLDIVKLTLGGLVPNQPDFTVKINGDPDLVAQLKRVVGDNPDTMKLESAGPSAEPSHLRLGLAEAATIVALVNGVATLGKFAYSIYRHLSENKASVVTVQTPLRIIEIRAPDAVSEESVVERLGDALRT
jgi:hypothetical protein